MKPFKIIILIAFVFVSIAAAAVFIGEKIGTDKTYPIITVEEEMIEVSLKAKDEQIEYYKDLEISYGPYMIKSI